MWLLVCAGNQHLADKKRTKLWSISCRKSANNHFAWTHHIMTHSLPSTQLRGVTSLRPQRWDILWKASDVSRHHRWAVCCTEYSLFVLTPYVFSANFLWCTDIFQVYIRTQYELFYLQCLIWKNILRLHESLSFQQYSWIKLKPILLGLQLALTWLTTRGPTQFVVSTVN